MQTLVLAFVALAEIGSPAYGEPAAIVRGKIEAGAAACMSGRPADVVRDYAEDIILEYPDARDQGFADLAKAFERLCGSAKGTVETTRATFEEVYVSGSIVVARLFWTTRLRGAPPGTVRYLRDTQVWEKRKGRWLFVRGVHYPIDSPPASN